MMRPAQAGAPSNESLRETLRQAAVATMERAYAPYSQFRVGAALAGTEKFWRDWIAGFNY